MALELTRTDLVLDRNKVIGKLVRFGIPTNLARVCNDCGEVVPVRLWEHHRQACHTVGWGKYTSPLANLRPATKSKRRTNNDQMVAELVRLLG